MKPWENEPNEERGEMVRIWRTELGHLCGYVGVPEGHPYHGMEEGNEVLYTLDVHGGVTFAGQFASSEFDDCDLWWLGFDCAHLGDLSPNGFNIGGTYRDINYVRSECVKLFKQLAHIAQNGAQ
jgi:hypothetical protein